MASAGDAEACGGPVVNAELACSVHPLQAQAGPAGAHHMTPGTRRAQDEVALPSALRGAWEAACKFRARRKQLQWLKLGY